ncbi:MAG: hypothetical protein KGJ62_06960 [Armatimonadetes bacterium]|nr:hypothetical protein [Armatimonadota bacterium]MDE2207391.1 hypothetical protein [Armatimonadota bacterium]
MGKASQKDRGMLGCAVVLILLAIVAIAWQVHSSTTGHQVGPTMNIGHSPKLDYMKAHPAGGAASGSGKAMGGN